MIAALNRWLLEQLIKMHKREARNADALAKDQRRKASKHCNRAEQLERDLMMHDLSHYEESLKGN